MNIGLAKLFCGGVYRGIFCGKAVAVAYRILNASVGRGEIPVEITFKLGCANVHNKVFLHYQRGHTEPNVRAVGALVMKFYRDNVIACNKQRCIYVKCCGYRVGCAVTPVRKVGFEPAFGLVKCGNAGAVYINDSRIVIADSAHHNQAVCGRLALYFKGTAEEIGRDTGVIGLIMV